MPLGDFPGSASGSVAVGISPDGTAVVGSSDFRPASRGLLWTEQAGLVPILTPSGALPFRVIASATSPGGGFVTGIASPGSVAFRWSAATGLRSIGYLEGAGTLVSQGYGISDDGQVIVGASQGQAFRWTPAGGMVALGLCPAARRAEARGVSADGGVVVGFCDYMADVREAFRWTEREGTVPLGPLGERLPHTRALAVSPEGSVIVGFAGGAADEPIHAIRWTAERGVHLLSREGEPPCWTATDVSADGSVVIARCGEDANIWDELYGPRDLAGALEAAGVDLTGWSDVFPVAVSDDGSRFAGTARRADGRSEAFLAVLPREVDSDRDGVLDADDRCPSTPRGEIVHPRTGCSTSQHCPCAAMWRSRGNYLYCVAVFSAKLARSGAMAPAERREILRAARRGECGRRPSRPKH